MGLDCSYFYILYIYYFRSMGFRSIKLWGVVLSWEHGSIHGFLALYSSVVGCSRPTGVRKANLV